MEDNIASSVPAPGSLLAAALRYAERGWYVFPAFVVWNAETRAKESRFPPSWDAASTTDPAMIAAWFGPGGLYREHGHLCIDTGKSGLVVVDCDGAAGMAEWESLRAMRRDCPETYRTATPGGGQHWYYRARPGETVTNSASKLAPGVDVRGVGGLVYAPPSADARGLYRWLEGEPELLDGIPFVPRSIIEATAPAREYVKAPALAAPVIPGLASAPRIFTPGQAQAFLAGKYAEFWGLRSGIDHGYNAALFELAQMVDHFVPAFYSHEGALAWLLDACKYNGMFGWPGEDPEKTIRRAWREYPADWRAVMPPDPAEVIAGEPMGSHSQPGAEIVPAPVALPSAEPVDLVSALMSRMIDSADLGMLAYPEPLIDGVLDLDSESWIIGGPGSFKSFVALDWACHIATGRESWRGQGVKAGRVVYVVAEGKKGIRQRAEAWAQTYGARPERGSLLILPEPVQVADALGWAVLVEACRRVGPALIVLDTQARITVGLDENSNGAMGTLTEAVRALKAATGACVLVVHHTGRDGQDARGASAIDGAQDTEIRVDRPKTGRGDLTATIGTDKQKDGDESLGFEVKMQVVQLGTNPATGKAVASLALAPFDPAAEPLNRPAPDWVANLTDLQAEILAAMTDHSDEHGATRAQAISWIKDRRERDGRAPMKGSSFDTAVKALIAKDLLARVKGPRLVLSEFCDTE